MRTYVVMRYVGITLVLLAGVMLLVLAYSLAINDGAGSIFLYSGLITFFTGLLPVLFVPHERQLSEREGYSIVVYAWLAVCFWGMIPYALYGKPFDLASAWFESASGFTTTGATMLSEVEALPKSVLLYRALTQWGGGLGRSGVCVDRDTRIGQGAHDAFAERDLGDCPAGLPPAHKSNS